jgi:uncharacterized membrane protein (DUF485 family)
MIYFLIWLIGVVICFVGSALYYRIANKRFDSDPILDNAFVLGVVIIFWPVSLPLLVCVFVSHLVFIQFMPWLWKKIARQ